MQSFLEGMYKKAHRLTHEIPLRHGWDSEEISLLWEHPSAGNTPHLAFYTCDSLGRNHAFYAMKPPF